VTDRPGWQGALESELRAVGRELQVPPPGDAVAAVMERLRVQPVTRRPAWSAGAARRRPWLAALAAVAVVLGIVIATPQGRAAIQRVFRFVGVELRQGPGPVPSPGAGASLPGQRSMALRTARREVSFPILVPRVLGQPDAVLVSDRGRVVSLIYRRTRYGLVRLDEFAGHIDQLYFKKFVNAANITGVQVNGATALWIKGPHVLVYVTRAGYTATASARLTTGNTLLWTTRHVALRLEGNLGESAALAIADSAR
jgi:hypothetical protein